MSGSLMPLLGTSEVARAIDVDQKTVYEWTRKGYIACCKRAGKHRKYRPADVVEFMRGRQLLPPRWLLALVEAQSPLAGFLREDLEEELKGRGIDYRGFVERLAAGHVVDMQRPDLIDERVKLAAQRVLTGDARQGAS